MEALLGKYKGGGTSSYHPRMMLKVLVYAYTQRVYSSRQIAKALRENVNYMWLSGGNRPDFRTLNAFRGERMKEVIEAVFTSVLELLVEEGYVELENYFVDGTKVEANANRHKVVWAKSRAKYQERLREKVKELLKEIDAVNAAEDEAYGDKDLDEKEGGGEIDAEKLEKKIEELNRRLKEQPEDKKLAKAVKVMEKDYLPRQKRYEEQERKLAGRNSYSKTDEDATFMRMKEDRGAEKAIAQASLQRTDRDGRAVCGGFQPAPTSWGYHLPDPAPGRGQGQPADALPSASPKYCPDRTAACSCLPHNISADAGYGSEENYAYFADNHLENYVKYNTFHREQQHHRKPELVRKAQFRTENLPYDPETDSVHLPCQPTPDLSWHQP